MASPLQGSYIAPEILPSASSSPTAAATSLLIQQTAAQIKESTSNAPPPKPSIWRRASSATAALATLSLSLSVLYLYPGNLLLSIAFGPTICWTVPLLLWQAWQLRKHNGQFLRYWITETQSQAERFKIWNDQLARESQRLQDQCQQLEQRRNALDQSLQQRGFHVQQVEGLLQEYTTIQRTMKRLQTAQELQHMLQVMLRADRDHDGHFSAKELEELLVRLNTFGVEKNRLRRVFAMASTQSLQRIYNAAANEYEQHMTEQEMVEQQARVQQQQQQNQASASLCHTEMENGCRSDEAFWGTWDHYNADGQRQLSIV